MSLLAPLARRLHAPVYRCRQAALTAALAPHLEPTDRLLDLGCGGGALAAALASAVPGLHAEGAETHPRGGEPIPVTPYDGRRLPFAAGAFSVVTVADVLHHDPDPVAVLTECARVASRLVIVKDHHPGGQLPLAHARICLMDWAANTGYGVECLYDYPDAQGWRHRFAAAGLHPAHETTSLQLYPRPYRWLFTPGLQYLAVCGVGCQ
ncbi:class I SAM-dependent methyltransferase [Phycisphaera mikurensis]|uniref:Uncharacterized protein n=1 Tax=Phycisphaera mikurensis (strain NBRC 102666 / KCTC 22515 / FYK2301M01) TaxID=1142394 RepID=I0IAF3_PHYMF|nr:methyltransferase domain-containing protein [Phycisphaera mikurensis]MBB6441762.1 SAM-dependent methyltransferase [Phycisphaera mikurensis]BAM02241.1 hypothetical protein PSMK_00820 [Phycisphaera mikurensis NBRC 102666]